MSKLKDRVLASKPAINQKFDFKKVLKPGKRPLRLRNKIEKMLELKLGVMLLQRNKLLGRRLVKLEVVKLGMKRIKENKIGGRTEGEWHMQRQILKSKLLSLAKAKKLGRRLQSERKK